MLHKKIEYESRYVPHNKTSSNNSSFLAKSAKKDLSSLLVLLCGLIVQLLLTTEKGVNRVKFIVLKMTPFT